MHDVSPNFDDIEDILIFRTNMRDFYLLGFFQEQCRCSGVFYREFKDFMSVRQERINMIQVIPEINIVILGNPGGFVAVCALLHNKNAADK
jgi:hypothetical protein